VKNVPNQTRVQEIKDCFTRPLEQGETESLRLWMAIRAACTKAENAALYPNDPSYTLEYKRWIRELEKYYWPGKPLSKKADSSLPNVITLTDPLRARALSALGTNGDGDK